MKYFRNIVLCNEQWYVIHILEILCDDWSEGPFISTDHFHYKNYVIYGSGGIDRNAIFINTTVKLWIKYFCIKHFLTI